MIKMTSERPLYVQGEARTEFEVPEHEARELEEAGLAVRAGAKPADTATTAADPAPKGKGKAAA